MTTGDCQGWPVDAAGKAYCPQQDASALPIRTAAATQFCTSVARSSQTSSPSPSNDGRAYLNGVATWTPGFTCPSAAQSADADNWAGIGVYQLITNAATGEVEALRDGFNDALPVQYRQPLHSSSAVDAGSRTSLRRCESPAPPSLCINVVIEPVLQIRVPVLFLCRSDPPSRRPLLDGHDSHPHRLGSARPLRHGRRSQPGDGCVLEQVRSIRVPNRTYTQYKLTRPCACRRKA